MHDSDPWVLPKGADASSIPREGPLYAHLLLDDSNGDRLVEFALPDLIDGGPVPFKCSWWSVSPGSCSPMDAHLVKEIWFIAGGEGRLSYRGEDIPIRAGQCVLFEPWQPHQVFNELDINLVVFSVWWP